MPRRGSSGLPAVLAVPLLADRLSVELDGLADDVAERDESPAGRERVAFLRSAALQVDRFGTAATTEVEQGEPEPAAFVPGIVGDDLETRAG